MFTLSQARLRPIHSMDLAAVMRIQAEAYADDILESLDVMQARLEAVTDSAWVVECNGDIYAYLLAYWSLAGQVTPWGKAFSHQHNADTFYLHDLAIGERARGVRLGPWLVQQVLAQLQAEGRLRYAALVSVQGTQGFWEKLGFVAVNDLPEAQQRHLHTYNTPAIYMQRSL